MKPSPFTIGLVISVLLPALAGGIVGQCAWSAPYKLRVEENSRLPVHGPTLNRSRDVDKNSDPFSSEDETLDAPAGSFKPETPLTPPKPPANFPLRAEQSGYGGGGGMPQQAMMAPRNMGGIPDSMPEQNQPQQQSWNPNDPDSSPDMQLAWDMWHKRVAATIFERFNFFAKAAFRHSPPLMAKISYAVTRDGQIINMNMQQNSTNVLFNVLVFQSVKSLNGDRNVLPFPQGSRRMVVQKFGTFTQNYGQEGFRYTVGDKETVQGQGR